MSQATTATSDTPAPVQRPRTIGGELFASFWQLSVLVILSVGALVAFVMVSGGGHRLARVEREQTKQLVSYRAEANNQADRALRKLKAINADMSSEVKPPTAEIEKFEASIRALAQNGTAAGTGGKPEAGGGASSPAAPDAAGGAVPETLIATIRGGNWAGASLVVQEMRKFGANENTRGEIREACLVMLQAFKAGPREVLVLFDLAVAWNDKKLGAAVLQLCEAGGAQYAGPQMFDAAAKLSGVVEADRVAMVLPNLVTAQMMGRNGNIPDFVTQFPPAVKLAAIAPPNASCFGSLVVQDTPAGDLIRSTLALKDHWPDEITKELTKSFSNPAKPVNRMLMTWLEQCNCPPAAKNAILSVALRMVGRQDDGDISDELLGVSLIAFATNSESIGRVAPGARRLAEANPEVGKQLLLRLLLGHPRQTLPVFVQAAEEGRPILPPDPTAACWAPLRNKPAAPSPFVLPCLELAMVRDFVDSIIAPALAGTRPRDWPRGLVIVAGDWGGPVTQSILNRADRQQVADAQLTETVDAARKKIEARAKLTSRAPGVAQ